MTSAFITDQNVLDSLTSVCYYELGSIPSRDAIDYVRVHTYNTIVASELCLKSYDIGVSMLDLGFVGEYNKFNFNISHIETGRKKASLESLVKIAAALDVTLDRILFGNQPNDLKNYLPELESLMESCSSYERAIIYDMVKSVRESLTKNKGLIFQSDQSY